MKFAELARVFVKIEATDSRNSMMEILAELIFRGEQAEVEKLVNLALGRLRPKYDRLEFNLADKMVVRAIARAGKVRQEIVEGEYRKAGDLGIVAQEIAGGSDRGLTIGQVYDVLESIAKEEGQGSQERKVAGLADLITQLDGPSRRYVVRMVLAKLRLGFSDKTVLDALSFMEHGSKEGREVLDSAYQVAPDAGKLASIVKSKGVAGARGEVRVTLGVPVMPALAQRLKTANEMIDKMGEVIAEPKFDGSRVQIHVSKSETRNPKSETRNNRKQVGLFAEERNWGWVRAFTRNLDESTEMFPELAEIGTQIKADSVIIDSEAVGYDPKTGKMVPFQVTITRKRKHGIAEARSAVPVKFYVFDILYKDGKSLVELPLSERRKILKETIAPGEGHLVVDEFLETDNPEELRKYHQAQLDKGLEGAMVKKREGMYEPGRTGWNWVKFKEVEGSRGKLSDTIDGVVLGYYFGQGKRAKFGVGKILLGVRDGEKFRTVTKVGAGITDEQLAELKRRLDPLTVSVKPEGYLVEKQLVPDHWVRPELVLEVAADEVTKSSLHTAGVALRFPRLVRFRDDKEVSQATDLTELSEIG